MINAKWNRVESVEGNMSSENSTPHSLQYQFGLHIANFKIHCFQSLHHKQNGIFTLVTECVERKDRRLHFKYKNQEVGVSVQCFNNVRSA